MNRFSIPVLFCIKFEKLFMNLENLENTPAISIPKRCPDCDKPFTSSGFGAALLLDCPGGICEGCGKPALVELVKYHLALPKSLDDQDGMSTIFFGMKAFRTHKGLHE